MNTPRRGWISMNPSCSSRARGLADRGAGDPELLRHLAFVEAQIRPLVIDVHRRDAVLQHLVNVLFQAEIAANRLELQLGALAGVALVAVTVVPEVILVCGIPQTRG
jgi:hypothetical protein